MGRGGLDLIDLVEFRAQLAAERRRRRRWRSVLVYGGLAFVLVGAGIAGYVRGRNAARYAAAVTGGAR